MYGALRALRTVRDTIGSTASETKVSVFSTFFRRLLAASLIAVAATAAPPARADAPSLVGKPLPPFVGITAWLNSPPLSARDLRGKVVLLEFWTFDCINCKHVIPSLVAWNDRYRKDGLTIIGVHTPELPFERDVNNVKRAVAADGIAYPVAFDPAYATWNAFKNDAWPHIYLTDRRGVVRYETVGEGGYAQTEAEIRTLLAAR